jgi:hypothetical protein
MPHSCSHSRPPWMPTFSQILPAPVSASLEKRQASPFRPRSILPRRIRAHFFGLLFLASIALFFHYNYSSTSTSNPDHPDELLSYLRDLPKPEGGPNPPRFYEWHDHEKLLPQHNVDLPYPQGREGRYIRFTNQVTGAFSFSFFPRLRRSCSVITKLIADHRIKASAGAMRCKKCCSTPILHTFPSERRSTHFCFAIC